MAMILGGIMAVGVGIALWGAVAEPTLKPRLSIYLPGLGATAFMIGLYVRWESQRPCTDGDGSGRAARSGVKVPAIAALPASARATTLGG